MLVVISAPLATALVVEAEEVGAVGVDAAQHAVVVVVFPVAFVHLGAVPLDASAFADFCAWSILAKVDIGTFRYQMPITAT